VIICIDISFWGFVRRCLGGGGLVGDKRYLRILIVKFANKLNFTGNTSGLHTIPTSLLSASDFVSTHHQNHHNHHQPSTHFRFTYTDIHGVDVSFTFLSFSQILCPTSTNAQRVWDRVSIKAYQKNVLIVRVREKCVPSLNILCSPTWLWL
jgi:hypothetical protein